MTIDFENLVAGLKASFRRRRVDLHVADRGCRVRFVNRVTDRPDNGGEEERKKQTEERTSERDDDFIERRNLREFRAVNVGFALNDIHRRELRQFHETAEWDGA